MCEGYNNALTMSTPKNGGLWQLLAALKNENSFTICCSDLEKKVPAPKEKKQGRRTFYCFEEIP